MNTESYLAQMWQQAETWQIAAALFGGLAVGVVYFQSLRWSLNHLSGTKHKIRLFASAHRNPAVILLYVLAFFVMKMAVMLREKGQIVKFETEKKQ